MTSETKTNESTNYEYLYTNIHLLFRHTNIGPSIDINNFELFKKYLQKIGDTNLDSTADIDGKVPKSETIKLCLEETIIKLNDNPNHNDHAIMEELNSTIKKIEDMNTNETDKTIKYVLEKIINLLKKIEEEETLYFIEHKLFTLKEYINDNILKCLSYIDKLQELNYQWFNNITVLKDIFIIIKEGTYNDDNKNSTKLTNVKTSSTGKEITSKEITGKQINVKQKLDSTIIPNTVAASAATASIVSSQTTFRGGLKLSDFEYIKNSIKLKISLIKPKQKILYQ